MAFGSKKKKEKEAAAAAAAAAASPEANIPKPPTWFWVVKYFLFAAVLGMAMGMWAIVSQHLQRFPFTYDGPDLNFQNTTVDIAYCLFSNSRVLEASGSQWSRCGFATAAPSVSFAIAVFWMVVQGLRTEMDKNYRQLLWVDEGLCLFGAGWWIVAGVLVCIWTSEANAVGLPNDSWRNGYCAMAWICFVLYFLLAGVTFIMMSRRARRAAFTPHPKKPKEPKVVASEQAHTPLAPAAAPFAPAAAPLDVELGPGVVGPAPVGAWGTGGAPS